MKNVIGKNLYKGVVASESEQDSVIHNEYQLLSSKMPYNTMLERQVYAQIFDAMFSTFAYDYL